MADYPTEIEGSQLKMTTAFDVLNRDTCRKCNLPVFVVDRLEVSERIYHRTCLKCARCSSQLAPGSFYETEVDNEYCCETCPDEIEIYGEISEIDVTLENITNQEACPSLKHQVRRLVCGSIAKRVAFFEQDRNCEGASSDSNELCMNIHDNTIVIEQAAAMSSEPTCIKTLSSDEGSEDSLIMNNGKLSLNVETMDRVKNVECTSDDESAIDIKDEKAEQPLEPVNAEIVQNTSQVAVDKRYPKNLNPFECDVDDDGVKDDVNIKENVEMSDDNSQHCSLDILSFLGAPNRYNPFDSSDDEVELEKSHESTSSIKAPPSSPSALYVSRKSVGVDTLNENMNCSRRPSFSSLFKKAVVTKHISPSSSQNSISKLTSRLSTNSLEVHVPCRLQNSNYNYVSENLLGVSTPQSFPKKTDACGFSNLLKSSSYGVTYSRKKRKSPVPPLPTSEKDLLPSTEITESAQIYATRPASAYSRLLFRKKRPAPAPPLPTSPYPGLLPQTTIGNKVTLAAQKDYINFPILDSKIFEEEKALIEYNHLQNEIYNTVGNSRLSTHPLKKFDESSLEKHDEVDDVKYAKCEENNMVYRPVVIHTLPHERNSLHEQLESHPHDYQFEKMKESQDSISAVSVVTDSTTFYNKSSYGKWKRRKGPAPPPPIQSSRVLHILPPQQIRNELELIEIKQRGLENHGINLEKEIRQRYEVCGESPNVGVAMDVESTGRDDEGKSPSAVANKVNNLNEVENLVLELYQLVNEKNDLLRRQSELLYMRRQYHLEQEQATLENEIRVLLAQSECNKTDASKAREEALIARLVEVVQLRNEVIESIEIDRLREAEEDLSIQKRIDLHNVQLEGSKLSKKKKKGQKESKKLGKGIKFHEEEDAEKTEKNKKKLKMKKRKNIVPFIKSVF